MSENIACWDDMIESLVTKIKKLRFEGADSEEIAKGLTAIKALGCGLRVAGLSEEKKHLRVRWFGKGKAKRGALYQWAAR